MHKRALTADKDIQTLKSQPVRAAVRNGRREQYPLDNEVGSYHPY
jgi:hypothetical protein